MFVVELTGESNNHEIDALRINSNKFQLTGAKANMEGVVDKEAMVRLSNGYYSQSIDRHQIATVTKLDGV